MLDREAIALAAGAVMRQHGTAAVEHAKRMSRRYTKAGKGTVATEWLQISRLIEETEATEATKRPSPSSEKGRVAPGS